MATDAYDLILNRFGDLTVEQQTRLLRELADAVARRGTGSRRSLLELRGLGKETWDGVDAAAYVRSERSSWRG